MSSGFKVGNKVVRKESDEFGLHMRIMNGIYYCPPREYVLSVTRATSSTINVSWFFGKIELASDQLTWLRGNFTRVFRKNKKHV